MIQLVVNELIKIFKHVGTYLMIGILVIAVIASALLMKFSGSGEVPLQANWQEELRQENANLYQQMEEIQVRAPSMEHHLKKRIAINEYRIENNLAPETTMTLWRFIQESNMLISLVGLFSIVIAAGIVANEFQWGTIKLLLIRPIKRSKILLSKYIAVLVFSASMLVLLFVTAAIVGVLTFGLGDGGYIYLAYVDGVVQETHIFGHLLNVFALSSVDMLMLTTMAFMISTVFKTSSLAVGLSIFLLFMGDTVTNFAAMKFESAKYSLFANTNLLAYFDGAPLVEGMTLGFSIVMLIVYFLMFHLFAFSSFTKRDVAS